MAERKNVVTGEDILFSAQGTDADTYICLVITREQPKRFSDA